MSRGREMGGKLETHSHNNRRPKKQVGLALVGLYFVVNTLKSQLVDRWIKSDTEERIMRRQDVLVDAIKTVNNSITIQQNIAHDQIFYGHEINKRVKNLEEQVKHFEKCNSCNHYIYANASNEQVQGTKSTHRLLIQQEPLRYGGLE